MTKRIWLVICAITIIAIGGLYIYIHSSSYSTINKETNNNEINNSDTKYSVTAGTEEYRGFILDNVLHTNDNGDIHYNVYIPDSYDGSEAYALYFTLPGY